MIRIDLLNFIANGALLIGKSATEHAFVMFLVSDTETLAVPIIKSSKGTKAYFSTSDEDLEADVTAILNSISDSKAWADLKV